MDPRNLNLESTSISSSVFTSVYTEQCFTEVWTSTLTG